METGSRQGTGLWTYASGPLLPLHTVTPLSPGNLGWPTQACPEGRQAICWRKLLEAPGEGLAWFFLLAWSHPTC